LVGVAASALLPGLDGDFTDRLDLVTMSELCLMGSLLGQLRWLQEIRVAGASQGGGF
jgi:hypothetical protein